MSIHIVLPKDMGPGSISSPLTVVQEEAGLAFPQEQRRDTNRWRNLIDGVRNITRDANTVETRSSEGGGRTIPTRKPSGLAPLAHRGDTRLPEQHADAQEASSARKKFGDLKEYWKHFDKDAEDERDEMVNGMKDNLDNLLIFVRNLMYLPSYH